MDSLVEKCEFYIGKSFNGSIHSNDSNNGLIKIAGGITSRSQRAKAGKIGSKHTLTARR